MNDLNVKVIDEIVKRLPEGEKTVSYLMDTLCMGKESAYRRLKSQIPFTFEEVVTVSQNLGFSIDKMLEGTDDNRIFFDMQVDITKGPEEIFLNMLNNTRSVLKKLASSEKVVVVAAINQLPFHFLPFDIFLKYEYAHYLYSNGYVPLMTRFSDIVVSPQMENIHKECVYYFSRLKNITCIIDNMLCPKIIKEIQYYRDLKFISGEDLDTIQANFFELFELFETMVRVGQNHLGSVYSIYYSFHSIDSNSVYCEYDDKIMSQIWLYPESPIIINNNSLICNMQKRWLDSRIRNSMLISKSNDVQQIETLRDMHKQISELQK